MITFSDHRSWWQRLKKLDFKVGPVGAGLELENRPVKDYIERLPRIRESLDSDYGLKYFTDPLLRAGDWFVFDSLEMVYGIPDFGGREGAKLMRASVLFVGSQSGNSLILGGSSEYLLDRRAHDNDSGLTPSVLADLLDVLTFASDDGASASANEERISYHGAFQASLHYLRMHLGRGHVEVMSGLARAAEISQGNDSEDRIILGSPLYVTFTPRDD